MYLAFFYLSSGGMIQMFQLIWAVIEVLHLRLLHRLLCDNLRVPSIVVYLLFASNRLHLYNVRVVINDFPAVVLVHLAIWLILQKRLALGAVFYSLAVCTKLNFIFYSPAVFVLYLHLNRYRIGPIAFHFSLMALFQVLPAVPFLAVNWRGYILATFDIGRTLLWEKTRSFKFVGRIIYSSRMFNTVLLFTISVIVLIVMLRSFALLWRRAAQPHEAQNVQGNKIRLAERRFLAFIFFLVNFVFITFARGLYTPFLSWYLYSLPTVMYVRGWMGVLFVAWPMSQYLVGWQAS